MTEEQMARTGDYVLGLLEGEALAAFEADLLRDPDLRATVERLQQHLQALDDTARPEAAGPGLWASISDQLDGPVAGNVVALPQPRRISSVRWMAMAASIVVAWGTGYLAGSFGTTAPQPVMVAVLINESDSAPGAIVEAFADDSVRLVPLEAFAVGADQVLQVWTLPDAETGPVSLGTFTDPATIRLNGPDLPAPQDGQLYEITLEPAPGSPTGRPTGPILVKGFAKAPRV